jgi:hypothetical protein
MVVSQLKQFTDPRQNSKLNEGHDQQPHGTCVVHSLLHVPSNHHFTIPFSYKTKPNIKKNTAPTASHPHTDT